MKIALLNTEGGEDRIIEILKGGEDRIIKYLKSGEVRKYKYFKSGEVRDDKNTLFCFCFVRFTLYFLLEQQQLTQHCVKCCRRGRPSGPGLCPGAAGGLNPPSTHTHESIHTTHNIPLSPSHFPPFLPPFPPFFQKFSLMFCE